ncbi:MAG: class I tRNA ligase family protein, partial [Firmicutes bacterium]|nr:class I tRNA ligase family protein [Bacillota bacterium]
LRFMMGVINHFDPKKDRIAFEDLNEVDKFVNLKLNNLIKTTTDNFENFSFDTVYREVTNFVTRELSAFYLDFAKDVLYIEKADDHARRSMQTVIYDATLSLLQLLTPFIPHTTHEAYSYLPFKDFEDVYLENMPEYVELGNEEIIEKYENLLLVRDNVLKALEEARNNKVIGKSFNAKLILYPNAETKALLNSLNANLGQIFIVSQFEISEGTGEFVFPTLSIDVLKAEGETCDRCWQVVDHTHDGLCHRCENVVK